jgi:two-component system, NtrC family, response regulator AtoC
MTHATESGMALGVEVANLPSPSILFGRSSAMELVHQKVERVAGTNVPVLIQGESGTGKELIAKLLHHCCPWGDGPFVKVNCPAIPVSLLESELFGYEKGAFTGAYGTKPGRVELAHRGTLFLDEIGEMDLGLQAKLLQLLQDGQFSRIGAHEDKKVEVRVVCATNRQLEKEIEHGRFRQDLFYRINVVNLRLPPLRERREDIPDLAEYFLSVYTAMFKCPARKFSHSIMQLLQNCGWPGNIRQLENIVKRYVILGSEESISSELIGQPATSSLDADVAIDENLSLKELTQQAVLQLERKVILRTLQTHHWNRKRAAKALRISYRALLYKIRDSGLPSRNSLDRADKFMPAAG